MIKTDNNGIARCKHGHALNEKTQRIRKDGKSVCKVCDSEQRKLKNKERRKREL